MLAMIPHLFLLAVVGATKQESGWKMFWHAQCSQPWAGTEDGGWANETHPWHKDFVIQRKTNPHWKDVPVGVCPFGQLPYTQCKWGPISLMCGTRFNNRSSVDIFANFITGGLYVIIAIHFMWLALVCWNARSFHCILCMLICTGIYELMLGGIDHDRSRHVLDLPHKLCHDIKTTWTRLFIFLDPFISSDLLDRVP